MNCDRKRSMRSLYIQGMKIWFFVSFSSFLENAVPSVFFCGCTFLRENYLLNSLFGHVLWLYTQTNQSINQSINQTNLFITPTINQSLNIIQPQLHTIKPFSGRTICSIVSSVTFSGYTLKPINQSINQTYLFITPSINQ